MSNSIDKLSYPDFVAYIGQTNTPPGGTKTIEMWKEEDPISSSDYVLDLACTTGFSSRYLNKLVNCKCIGIDISQIAIQQANLESQKLNLQNMLSYEVQDATNMNFTDETFEHILGGCNFAFIQRRDSSLKECYRILKENGTLCVSNFFYTSPPPQEIIDKVFQTINFEPNPNWNQEWWKDFFQQYFKPKFSQEFNLKVFSDQEIKDATYNYIFKESSTLKDKDENLKNSCFERLYRDRLILNNHRKFQKYAVEIWVKKFIV